MPLNCSTFVTQKEQLKCQAARRSIKNVVEKHKDKLLDNTYTFDYSIRQKIDSKAQESAYLIKFDLYKEKTDSNGKTS